MAGNKKEIIRELKIRLEICNSKKELYKAILIPIQEQNIQRGIRLQLMMKFLEQINRELEIEPPQEFFTWFDEKGILK